MEDFPDPFARSHPDNFSSKDSLKKPVKKIKGKGLSIPDAASSKTSSSLPLPWVRPANASPVDFTGGTLSESPNGENSQEETHDPDVLLDNVTGLPFVRHVNKYAAGDSMRATKEALDKYRGNSTR
jgi:hypothetical protein